jgi:hypothetical protein
MSQGCPSCPEWDSLRILNCDVETAWGTYSVGMLVLLLRFNNRHWAQICVDQPYGQHLIGVCHSVVVRSSSLARLDEIGMSGPKQI